MALTAYWFKHAGGARFLAFGISVNQRRSVFQISSAATLRDRSVIMPQNAFAGFDTPEPVVMPSSGL